MARIVSLGSALQDIYLIDHDDLSPTKIGDAAIFGKVLVGSKVDIDKISYEVGGGGSHAHGDTKTGLHRKDPPVNDDVT